MTIKLSQDFENAKKAWIQAVQNNESTEKVGELYGEMLDQMISEAKKPVKLLLNHTLLELN